MGGLVLFGLNVALLAINLTLVWRLTRRARQLANERHAVEQRIEEWFGHEHG